MQDAVQAKLRGHPWPALLLLLALLLVVAPASADDYMTDRLALSFDDGFFQPCTYWAAPFVPLTIHVILTEPSFAALHGWEAAIRNHDGSAPVLLSATVGLGGQNTGTWPEFAVSYPTPVATGNLMVLATVTILPLSWSDCLVLTGLRSPSLPDLRPLVWPSADAPFAITRHAYWNNGVAAATGGCAVIPEEQDFCATVIANEPVSWGGVKARYR